MKHLREIKPEHLKLLSNMVVSYDDCEFGAPAIDPKCPYGNSSVFEDMIEILGLKELKDGVFEFTLFDETWILKGEDQWNLYLDGKDEEQLKKKLEALHEELKDVLQICIQRQLFEVGLYAEDDFGKWLRIAH